MTLRLRDLIKEVRACKTAQEERAVIQRESAAIRQSFRKDEAEFRHRNVAKLMFVHMLGFPTYWGQMECLKLISSPLFTDKRIGYLGVMLLMDEKQEILTLVTQCLKNDLNHPNHFISGLALVSLGNISSAEIARDLAPEVEKLLGSKNPYLRKKAALCAIRTLRKCPDLMENFVPRVRALLAEKNHGVLVTGVKLMAEVCEADPLANVEFFRKLVPPLVRMLKTLSAGGLAPEYDVSGVTDPFLQVGILRLLRSLGRGHAEASDQMGDTLAQVATNTDHSRNVGNCVLYECVLTIFEVEADDELRSLAINVLARFLLHRDNNIRYVALSTLTRVVAKDAEAVQRHRNTIVECLKDPDISIRKRALELIYSLVNEANIQILAGELLNFLAVASIEFRPGLAAQLCVVAEKFSPSERWRIDTVLRVMQIAGNYVPDEVAANLIAMIGNASAETQAYAVQKMFVALNGHADQPMIVTVAAWIIGEFGDVLISSGNTVAPSAVVEVLARVVGSSLSTSTGRSVTITALVKLTERFGAHAEVVAQIRKVIAAHSTSADVEVQQRACEYLRILGLPNGTRNSVLGRMPAMAVRVDTAATTSPAGAHAAVAGPPAGTGSAADDLLGDLDAINASKATTNGGGADLLEDIFSSGPSPSVSASASSGGGLDDLLSGPSTGDSSGSAGGGVDDLFGDLLAPSRTSTAPDGFVAYEKNGVTGRFSVSRENADGSQLRVAATFTTNAPSPLNNFDFKVAVPTYMQLNIMPPSGTVVTPGGSLTQEFSLINKEVASGKPYIVKIRVAFIGGAGPVEDVADISLAGRY